MTTKPEVFIVESLSPDDEGNGRFEGAIVSRMLQLHGKNPKYRYVRNSGELRSAIRSFGKSNYRYLHISCHGDPEGMELTNQEEIDFDILAEMLQPHLKRRRLFISACSMVHKDLAEAVIPASGCYSVIGPTEDIGFADAAIFWSSLYHLLFSQSASSIKHATLKRRLQSASNLFRLDIAYYSKSKNRKAGFKENLLRK